MKILHTADWHIGNFPGPEKDGRNLRADDTGMCIQHLHDIALLEKPQMILVSGDIFHQARVWADRGLHEVEVAIRALTALSKICPVVVMRGTPNHDGSEQFSMLDAHFSGDDSVHIITEPTVFQVKGYKITDRWVNIACLPGFDRGIFRAKFPGLSKEEENVVFTEELGKTILALRAECDPRYPSVLMSHYGSMRPLVFAGLIVHCETEDDGADRCTTLEVEDSLVNLRDTFVTISYSGKINSKTILDDVANQMGVAVTYSYNAEFSDLPNGYSYVGQARNVLTVICKTSNLVWSLQNGILQIKKPGDTMSKQVFVLSATTGMVGTPRRWTSTATDDSKDDDSGWEVDYLMNTAINIDDYVYLQSKKATGYFRVYSVKVEGDTHGDRWICTAKLVAV